MQNAHPVSSLMLVTLGIVLVIVVGLLIHHMRKRSNRKPMEGVRERNIEEMQRGVPPGRE